MTYGQEWEEFKEREAGDHFGKLIVACVLVALAILALAFTAEAVAGRATCAERGRQVSGGPWEWAGGNTCWLPSDPHPKK